MQISKIYDSNGLSTWYKKPYFWGVGPWTIAKKRCSALSSVASEGNHSTEFAAIAFSDYIRRGIDLGLLTGSVFIDLRKAFDSVDHEILISKLESYGL